MGWGDTEEGNLKYNQFLAPNRRNTIRAGIDFERTYNKQKPETLAKLFKLVQALKQFVRNARRGVARKSRKCTVEARNDSGHDSDSSVGGPRARHPENGAGPSRLRAVDDDDDSDDDEGGGDDTVDDPFADDDDGMQ
ncbi:hypothetical protein HGRIS_001574 [Hohenbuehelia grisea]|uniref:Uncharacterized protein n=1 Tax=Hohenbuehelia grisea TaxID=104357 RepID=A0ABR3JR22_9AGAR